MGGPREPTVWTEEMVALATGMKRAGMTNKAIAERLGVTERAVAQRMHRAKVRRRLNGNTGGRVGPRDRGRLLLARSQHAFDDPED